MIKLTYCLHRLPSLTREEFQRYWRETHAPLVAAAGPALGIRRYVQCHTYESEIAFGTAAGRDMPHGEGEDFDGVAELWFDSEESVAALLGDEEGLRQAHILLEDERNFIDFARSRAFMVREHVVVGQS